MKRRDRRDATIRIRMVDGLYYAFAKGGIKHRRNWQLYFAIRFCRRLNAKLLTSV